MKDGTALLFGNIYQGELMHLVDLSQPLRVMIPPRPSTKDTSRMVPDEVLYEPRRMEIFGTVLHLHVERDLSHERLEAMLADHLLSDKAKAVIVGFR